MPRQLDDILDDAESHGVPEWKRTGNFELLVSPAGTAILYHTPPIFNEGPVAGMVLFADHVRFDLSLGPHMEMRDKCEALLRDRTAVSHMLALEEDEPELPQEPVPVPTPRLRPPPAPRVWGTIPIKNGED